MLGNNARVNVTIPINSTDKNGLTYKLNFGYLQSGKKLTSQPALVMGMSHPVNSFTGRVIAVLKRKGSRPVFVVAPKSSRYIVNDIKSAVAFYNKDKNSTLHCLYESSCGAVVFRFINGERRYLLIKNKRSANWGFPKGHIESGESREDTARREVLEETGIHIDILPGFVAISEYTLQNKVEKSVTIFVAATHDTQTKIQREEIADYIWLGYDAAMEQLKFENDRRILTEADTFLNGNGLTAAGKVGDAVD